MRIKILFGLITATVMAFAHADGISDLKQFLGNTHSLKAQFTQSVTGKGKAQVSSGVVAIMIPGKFRWEYQKPYQQLIVGDAKEVWLYDQDLKQATSKNVANALESSPAALLAGDAAWEKNYTLKALPDQDGLAWLEATPKRDDSSFEHIRLGLANGQIQRMDLFDKFGQTTQIRFSQIMSNPKLDTGLFHFTPPKDVDVVRE
ncbi:outer membrane lipoprotein chaperone LolA [Silvimonas sp.]|uniref:outer membrane lipoprotein chaperone LolA n=1 Tax=Silvimonas sp. TaxID=2650811 RepID=UPI002842CA9E|nr:outer membrane lipoprotein chaperone LolA [Silvimonas sp.]MDR3426361.1 outer membrane lipoprotein chaperone LolA [Silvimonas sp.]